MPGLDRTGPEGQGSRNGRQMGKCAPKSEENEIDRGPGRGFGRERGRARGRGFGRGQGRQGTG